jgi:hypothetical protein
MISAASRTVWAVTGRGTPLLVGAIRVYTLSIQHTDDATFLDVTWIDGGRIMRASLY